MTTLRMTLANRRNSEKSTGPKSADGKAVASRNGVKHGLAGEGVALPDADTALVAERMTTWRGSYHPRGPEQEWCFAQVVMNSVRIDRCRAEESATRAARSARAATCWDDDRGLDAEALAAGLARRPSVVAARLRTTRHGCLWLIGQWMGLGEALLAAAEAWDADQTSLAFDLLGTPVAFRGGTPWPADGSAGALVLDEIEVLEAKLDGGLDGLDAFARESSERGLDLVTGRAEILLRRYEAACYRRMETARRRLKALQDGTASSALPVKPTAPASPKPAPVEEDDDDEFDEPEAVPSSPVGVADESTLAPSARTMNRKQRRAAERRLSNGR